MAATYTVTVSMSPAKDPITLVILACLVSSQCDEELDFLDPLGVNVGLRQSSKQGYLDPVVAEPYVLVVLRDAGSAFGYYDIRID